MILQQYRPFVLAWLRGLIVGTGVLGGVVWAQTPAGTVTGGWRMPLMEQNRLKTLLTGDGAKTLESGALEISQVRIQLYGDQIPPEARLVIEAPQCVFESNRKNASSSGPITLKASDGTFSIEGKGFAWNQSTGNLVISNAVRTVISPTALGSEGAKRDPIHVNADHFSYDKAGNIGHYRGDVTATEGERFKLQADQIEVNLPEDENTPRRIKAIGKVQIQLSQEDRTTQLTGEQADYDTTDQGTSLRLTGEPSWRSGAYHGRGKDIVIEGLEQDPTFVVDGSATMTVPSPSQQVGGVSERLIEIRAASYVVTKTGAEFTGGVEAEMAPAWHLACRALTAQIEPEAQTITRIEANNEVMIRQEVDGDVTTASGDRAEFVPSSEVLTDVLISGMSRITATDYRTSADRIHWKKTATDTLVSAQGAVNLVLLGAAGGSSGLLSFNLPLSEATATNSEKTEISIRANRYDLVSGKGTFSGEVSVTDAHGVLNCEVLDLDFGASLRLIRTMTASEAVSVNTDDGTLTCQTLTGRFAQPGNRLLELIASENVELRRSNGMATGDRAVFLVARQMVELTGNPEVRTRLVRGALARNVVTSADRLIWDLANNTLKGRGHYRSRTLEP